jgi:uncharacterized membrane protein
MTRKATSNTDRGRSRGTQWSDQRMEQWVGNLLRAGVILSASVVLTGGLFYLVRYGATVPHDRVFHSEPADLRSVPGILRDVLHFSRRGIIQLGFLLLIATPVARVAFSCLAFAAERDGKYVLITLIVLSGLLYSLFSGLL